MRREERDQILLGRDPRRPRRARVGDAHEGREACADGQRAGDPSPQAGPGHAGDRASIAERRRHPVKPGGWTGGRDGVLRFATAHARNRIRRVAAGVASVNVTRAFTV